ncbi:hypothetical protein Desaci_4738 (plasmid) [Desulfosporosinus acidiphilus SJ4]|jgi:hypothetical protein|uniref:Uncharacterized protein n=1 Tax=Desulfosporosinus acidiphilus (strain DSM 22704 / JCM 16185 / SJ4) TaxID=646529 RepID=I4DCP0_DESAJ|nr:hypothetical protein [Desulfosporosinus acidiphilus]AFM43564.1 hypothetical protein Desaci_4738 [Desulfosporosinus acidiphilus SJ4]
MSEMIEKLKKPDVKWKKDNPGTLGFCPYHGIDVYGNKWSMTANLECVGVELTDGRKGSGWTEREAWERANSYSLEK